MKKQYWLTFLSITFIGLITSCERSFITTSPSHFEVSENYLHFKDLSELFRTADSLRKLPTAQRITWKANQRFFSLASLFEIVEREESVNTLPKCLSVTT